MAENSVFRKVIDEKNSADEMKKQVSIDVSPWDTSQMDGYVEGNLCIKDTLVKSKW